MTDEDPPADPAGQAQASKKRWIVIAVTAVCVLVILLLCLLHVVPVTLRGFLVVAGLLIAAIAVVSSAVYRKHALGARKIPATVLFNITVFLVSGLIVVSFCTWMSARTWAAGMLWAMACLGLGGTAGFLFGIPRSRVPGTAAQQAAAQAGGASGSESSPIEQISDWLTKIIVGLGLINLTKLPGMLYIWAGYVACSLDPCPAQCPSSHASLTSFALGIILYFCVLGLVSGYLLTQIFLLAYVNLMSAPSSGNVNTPGN
jgi:hypothetical protein